MATTVTIGGNTGGSANSFTGVIDTQLHQGAPTTNYGSAVDMEVTKYGVGDHTQSVLAFTGLTNIPSNATVSAVTLNLFFIIGGSATITLKRLLRNWVEAQATWNVYSTGNSWTTAGATSDGNDRSATVTAATAFNGTTQEASYIQFSDPQLVTDVQAFVAGTQSNYGWTLERTDGADDSIFSKFATTQGTNAQRPFLSVTYDVIVPSGPPVLYRRGPTFVNEELILI